MCGGGSWESNWERCSILCCAGINAPEGRGHVNKGLLCLFFLTKYPKVWEFRGLSSVGNQWNMNVSFRMYFPHPLQLCCNEEIMSYRHNQGCLGASSNIHFVRRTFSAESKISSRDILPAVSYLEINVMIFSQEFEGTYRAPSNGHYSVIVGENKFCCHFIDCLFFFLSDHEKIFTGEAQDSTL